MRERVQSSRQSFSTWVEHTRQEKNRLEKESAKVRAKLVRQLEDICSSFKTFFSCLSGSKTFSMDCRNKAWKHFGNFKSLDLA